MTSDSNDNSSNNSGTRGGDSSAGAADSAGGKVVARIVRCPQCGKSSEYSPRNSFRPFCSERCRLIDLGDWAEGRYTVPAEPHEMTPEEQEKLEAELEKLTHGQPDIDEES